jgi:hypothetical protein
MKAGQPLLGLDCGRRAGSLALPVATTRSGGFA